MFILFAKEALKKPHLLPSYDDVYDSIVKKIEENFGSHRNVMFTWLDDRQKSLAERDYRCYDIQDVPEIPQNFHAVEYIEYTPDFFLHQKEKRSFSMCGCSTSE